MIGFFNYIGLIIVFVMMVPNFLAMRFSKDTFVNLYNNKAIDIIEQIGRY